VNKVFTAFVFVQNNDIVLRFLLSEKLNTAPDESTIIRHDLQFFLHVVGDRRNDFQKVVISSFGRPLLVSLFSLRLSRSIVVGARHFRPFLLVLFDCNLLLSFHVRFFSFCASRSCVRFAELFVELTRHDGSESFAKFFASVDE
jgi:hypothetical protein